jgi:hypothetical protein
VRVYCLRPGVKELSTPRASTQDIVRFVRENVRAAV